jgi:hypothetical protein
MNGIEKKKQSITLCVAQSCWLVTIFDTATDKYVFYEKLNRDLSIKMVLLFMKIIWTIIITVDSCGPAWNTGGSCYSGYRAAGVGDLAVMSEFEQCYGDKNNWCTVR